MVDGVPAVSQAVATVSQAGEGVPRVAQANVLATNAGQGVQAVSMANLLFNFQPPETLAVNATQITASVSTAGQGVPRVTQGNLLFTFRTGNVSNLRSRAWQFSLDGHTFYVLTLGDQGTFVYDTTTDQWAQWITAGLPTWNMELGVTWKGDIIAADQNNPTVWRLDPTTFIDDDYKSMTRIVTGGLAMRQRTFIPNFAFRITASLGEPEVPLTFPETEPTVQLSYSDDQGKTFIDREALTLIEGAFEQQLQWLSLGIMQAPQRVFKVVDIGAIARIGGADAEVEEE